MNKQVLLSLTALGLLLGGCAKSTPAPVTDPVPEEAPATPKPVATVKAPEMAAPAQGAERVAQVGELLMAADRSEDDKALDAGRHPAELMAYYKVMPGMKVAEMMAGGGYTAEVLARTVGPEGVVYGVNSPFILERFAEESWSARLATPVMSNVVRLDRDFDNPFPDDVRDLDRVFSILVYHDFVWMGTDRAAMNKSIFDALKVGGIYAIVDHVAEEGSGVRDVKTLHRIDPEIIKEDVQAAGFTYVGEVDFLRNTEDTKDWNAPSFGDPDRRGTSDRVVMTFIKE